MYVGWDGRACGTYRKGAHRAAFTGAGRSTFVTSEVCADTRYPRHMIYVKMYSVCTSFAHTMYAPTVSTLQIICVMVVIPVLNVREPSALLFGTQLLIDCTCGMCNYVQILPCVLLNLCTKAILQRLLKRSVKGEARSSTGRVNRDHYRMIVRSSVLQSIQAGCGKVQQAGHKSQSPRVYPAPR